MASLDKFMPKSTDRAIMTFPPGKIDPRILETYFRTLKVFDKRLVIGPRMGEDTAVIDNGSTYLLLKTDPITFTAERIGWYSIHINANDIATMGGIPRFFLATILLPEKKTTKRLVARIMNDLKRALESMHITLCGGHTEVTPGLERVIISGSIIGEVDKNRLVRNDRIRAGDVIILAKGVSIEGTSVIAVEKERELSGVFSKSFIRRARNFIYNPGINVLQAAMIATGAARLSGMHDPTEGGLLGGIWETAYRQNLGFEIFADNVPVYKECRKLCDHYELDPLRLIASGALIIAARPRNAKAIINALTDSGISASRIGTYMPDHRDTCVITGTGKTHVRPPFIDEITKIL